MSFSKACGASFIFQPLLSVFPPWSAFRLRWCHAPAAATGSSSTKTVLMNPRLLQQTVRAPLHRIAAKTASAFYSHCAQVKLKVVISTISIDPKYLLTSGPALMHQLQVIKNNQTSQSIDKSYDPLQRLPTDVSVVGICSIGDRKGPQTLSSGIRNRLRSGSRNSLRPS
jgi:hypothetical protein